MSDKYNAGLITKNSRLITTGSFAFMELLFFTVKREVKNNVFN